MNRVTGINVFYDVVSILSLLNLSTNQLLRNAIWPSREVQKTLYSEIGEAIIVRKEGKSSKWHSERIFHYSIYFFLSWHLSKRERYYVQLLGRGFESFVAPSLHRRGVDMHPTFQISLELVSVSRFFHPLPTLLFTFILLLIVYIPVLNIHISSSQHHHGAGNFDGLRLDI